MILKHTIELRASADGSEVAIVRDGNHFTLAFAPCLALAAADEYTPPAPEFDGWRIYADAGRITRPTLAAVIEWADQ